MTGLVFLGDRETLYRQGTQRFLKLVSEEIRFIDAPLSSTWRSEVRNAISQLAEQETLTPVARSLGQTLRETLQAFADTEQQVESLKSQLHSAQLHGEIYERALRSLQADASVTNLRTFERQVAALQRELEAAQASLGQNKLALTAAHRTIAAREATIAELKAVIARQHLEFDALFGDLDDLE